MSAKQDKNSNFWDEVDHEIAEGVSSAQTGGKLDKLESCKKNEKLDHHKHLIPASEFQRQDLDVWNNLLRKFNLGHCFDFIKKLLIPFCVRLESMYVSEDRPTERYPLSGNRGQMLCLSKNVGSGWIYDIRPMSPHKEYMCVDCGCRWSVYCYKGIYDCPDVCTSRWRVMSEENRKCPLCDSDTREYEEGLLKCGRDKDKNCECFWKWHVVSEDVGGTCPRCQTEWWKTGEKDTCRCPGCEKMARKGCVCHGCLTSGKREKKWWEIWISTARLVIYDRKEWNNCDVIMFDDGENEPVKLTVGRSGRDFSADTDNDNIWLWVYTCDSELVDKLKKMLIERKEMIDRIWEFKFDVPDKVKVSHRCSGGDESEGRDKCSGDRSLDCSGGDGESKYNCSDRSDENSHKCSGDSRGDKCSDERSPECSGNNCSESSDENKGERKCSDSESECSDSESGDENDKVFPCVLIGYPHGRQCYVSLGESHTRHDSGSVWDDRSIQYEISSCPGFSGGLVWRPGNAEHSHRHRGSIKDKPHLGICTRDFTIFNSLS